MAPFSIDTGSAGSESAFHCAISAFVDSIVNGSEFMDIGMLSDSLLAAFLNAVSKYGLKT